jgi:hypothetical protein
VKCLVWGYCGTKIAEMAKKAKMSRVAEKAKVSEGMSSVSISEMELCPSRVSR